MIKKYRKKPVEIEAIKWTGENMMDVLDFLNKDIHLSNNKAVLNNSDVNGFFAGNDFKSRVLKINTLEGVMTANFGDYIIKHVKGEFYPIKEEIFNETYEKV